MAEKNISTELKDFEIEFFGEYIIDTRRAFKSDNDIMVYLGRKKDTKENVVFKLKYTSSQDSFYILKESKKYEKLEGIKRIPKLYKSGSQGNFRMLIIELLGPSLKRLLEYVGGKFSLATTLKISIQLLDIIKEIHNKGVVLRYLKPGNMVIGRGENRDYIYLIDFELAKNYLKNGEHIPYKGDKKVKGNRAYISINVHLGNEVSRRDDIESLGYNIIYFMKGKLPWSHIGDNHYIRQKKIDISMDELCEGLPEEFKKYIEYSRKLKFEQEPDYTYLSELLKKVAEKNGIDIDKAKYDWVIKKEEELKKKEGKENDKDKVDKKEEANKEKKEVGEKEKENEQKQNNGEKEEEGKEKENEETIEENEEKVKRKEKELEKNGEENYKDTEKIKEKEERELENQIREEQKEENLK